MTLLFIFIIIIIIIYYSCCPEQTISNLPIAYYKTPKVLEASTHAFVTNNEIDFRDTVVSVEDLSFNFLGEEKREGAILYAKKDNVIGRNMNTSIFASWFFCKSIVFDGVKFDNAKVKDDKVHFVEYKQNSSTFTRGLEFGVHLLPGIKNHIAVYSGFNTIKSIPLTINDNSGGTYLGIEKNSNEIKGVNHVNLISAPEYQTVPSGCIGFYDPENPERLTYNPFIKIGNGFGPLVYNEDHFLQPTPTIVFVKTLPPISKLNYSHLFVTSSTPGVILDTNIKLSINESEGFFKKTQNKIVSVQFPSSNKNVYSVNSSEGCLPTFFLSKRFIQPLHFKVNLKFPREENNVLVHSGDNNFNYQKLGNVHVSVKKFENQLAVVSVNQGSFYLEPSRLKLNENIFNVNKEKVLYGLQYRMGNIQLEKIKHFLTFKEPVFTDNNLVTINEDNSLKSHENITCHKGFLNVKTGNVKFKDNMLTLPHKDHTYLCYSNGLQFKEFIVVENVKIEPSELLSVNQDDLLGIDNMNRLSYNKPYKYDYEEMILGNNIILNGNLWTTICEKIFVRQVNLTILAEFVAIQNQSFTTDVVTVGFKITLTKNGTAFDSCINYENIISNQIPITPAINLLLRVNIDEEVKCVIEGTSTSTVSINNNFRGEELKSKISFISWL